MIKKSDKFERVILEAEIYDGESQAAIFQMDVRAGMTEKQIIKAIKDAASEYLHTEEGKETLQLNGGEFNYGDARLCIPDEITLKHGFRFLDDVDSYRTIAVDHDTHLVPKDLDE